jgi:hypothetical protein
MKSHSLKWFALLGLILFLGVAVAPNINAYVVEDALVDFDVEFYGLGKKYTVQLTPQKADELKQLLNDIEHQLSVAETREEAEIIFKDAVVELDKYGLLGGLNVKLAQKLIIGNNREKIMSGLGEDDNAFCLVAGAVDEFYRLSPISFGIMGICLLHFGLLTLIVRTLSALFPNLVEIILYGPLSDILFSIRYGIVSLYALLFFASIYIPINVFNWMYYGGMDSYYYSPYLTPTEGWLTTFGLNGKKELEGSFIASSFGFTGLKIILDKRDLYHIGSALFVTTL